VDVGSMLEEAGVMGHRGIELT